MDSSFRCRNKRIKLQPRKKFRLDTSLGCCSTLKLCSDGINLPEKDFISELPDVILISVLSLLTTKEAGRTSVLSKRWIHVWAYVPLLVFDASETLTRYKYDFITLEAERIKYLSCLDQVVRSHKAPTGDEFRLRFSLSANHKDSVDKWVIFAAEKRVKRLELNFGNHMGVGTRNLYNFPILSFWKSLNSFILDCVNITGEVLESLLHNCKALEFLSVAETRALVALKVVGPSLKSLRILRCVKLEKLEIYAPNLAVLDYCGPELCMPFKSTPKLADISLGGPINKQGLISPIVHQIEVLKLDMEDIKPVSKAFPECTRLKTLDIAYDPECENDLFLSGMLIKACPFLQKFVIQVDLSDLSKCRTKSEVKEEPWCHNRLKIVEIVGFEGCALPFVRSLIEHVVSLEKLIIDTQQRFDYRTPGEPVDIKSITKARKQAEKVHKYLKPFTELEIR